MGRINAVCASKDAEMKAQMDTRRASSVSTWSLVLQNLSKQHHESWGDFTRYTTFHGIKHIFNDSNKYPFRRTLWVVCVLFAITLFTYQVGTRIDAYLKHSSNVNIDIQGVKCDLNFPAVTVCNQNAFRLTQAVSTGMFKLLDTFYDSQLTTENNYSKFYPATNKTVNDIFCNLAHKKEDFIEWCWWNGEECDIKSSFKVTKTRLGPCFTFNFDPENVKTVNETGGRRSGLKLVLNVEQYEYMRGPQDDTGVKILLHEAGEYPAVLDQGFAAAPGTHTIVAVSQTRNSYLPEPYGTCGVNARPQTDCFLTCDTLQAYKICGCRDYYMDPVIGNESIPLCDLRSALECLPKAAFGEKDDSGCRQQCLLPCQRKVYMPGLSSSQLSQSNIERAVVKAAYRKDRINRNYHRAADIFQQVDIVASTRNAKLTSNFLDSEQAFTEKTNWAFQTMKTGDLLADMANSVNMLTNGTDLLTADFKEVRRAVQRMMDGLSEPFDGPPIWNFLDETQPSRKSLFQRYVNGDEKQLLFQDWCRSYANRKRQRQNGDPLFGDVMETTKSLPDIMKRNDIYNERLYFLYGNDSAKVVENYHKHKLCMRFVNVFNVTFHYYPDADIAWKCSKSGNFTDANDVAEMTGYLEPFFTEVRTILDDQDWNLLVNNNDFDDSCNWFKPSFERNKVNYDNINMLTLCQEHDLTLLSEKLSNIYKSFQIITTRFDKELSHFFNQSKLYKDGKITKLELAESVELTAVAEVVQDIRVHLRDIKDNTDKLVDQVTHFTNEWTNIVKSINTIDFPPLMSVPQLYNLNLFNKLAEGMPYDPLQDVVDFRTGLQAVKEIHNYHASTFYMNGAVIAQNISHMGDIFSMSALSFIDELKLYSNQMTINSDFYMKNFLTLSIYYRELSYQMVTQQKAFEFLSLLSEIGGFLGLLLGASILTVCELVDYLVTLATKTCAKRKDNKNDSAI